MRQEIEYQGRVDLWVRFIPAEGGEGHRRELGVSPEGGESPGEGFVRVQHVGPDAIAATLSPVLAEILFGLLAAYRTSGSAGKSMNKTFRDGYLSVIRAGIAWADGIARQIAEQERAYFEAREHVPPAP
jgi:hypothetical protein